MSERLHPDDLAALADLIADRLAERLAARELAGRWLTAAEVAQRFGVSAEWVREHRVELGAVRLGDGPRGRLRFDQQRVAEALSADAPTSARSPSSAGSVAESSRQRVTVATAGNSVPPLPVRELQPRLQPSRPGAARTARGTAQEESAS